MLSPYDHLMDVSRRFLAIVQEETSLLTTSHMGKALDLLPQKEALANEHAQAMEAYTQDGTWRQGPLSNLTGLKEMLDALQEALVENQQAISRVHAVQESIMGKITQAICEHDAPVYCYSKDRRQGSMSSPVSLSAYDQHI